MEGEDRKGDTRLLSTIFFLCLFSACWIYPHWWLHVFSWAAVSVPEVPVVREAGGGRSVPHCREHGPDIVCCGPGGVCRALLESRGMYPGSVRGWMLPGEQKCWLLGGDVMGRGFPLGFFSFSLWWLVVSAPPAAWACNQSAWLVILLAGWRRLWKGNMLFLNLTKLSTAPLTQPRSERGHHQCWPPSFVSKQRA